MKVIGLSSETPFWLFWKHLGIVRTTFEKNPYQRRDHRAWFQILWSPLTFDRKFSNALKSVFITWKWLVKFRNSFLIVWKRLGIVRTLLKKIDTKGGTTGPDFKSFGPPFYFQMPWMPFLSDESDWLKFRNSFLIVWKRLGIVRTTFERNRYQRRDHRAWFQILWPPPLTFDRTPFWFSNALNAVFPLVPPYLWPKIFKCLECRFCQMKVIGLSSETPFWLFESVSG